MQRTGAAAHVGTGPGVLQAACVNGCAQGDMNLQVCGASRVVLAGTEPGAARRTRAFRCRTRDWGRSGQAVRRRARTAAHRSGQFRSRNGRWSRSWSASRSAWRRELPRALCPGTRPPCGKSVRAARSSPCVTGDQGRRGKRVLRSRRCGRRRFSVYAAGGAQGNLSLPPCSMDGCRL